MSKMNELMYLYFFVLLFLYGYQEVSSYHIEKTPGSVINYELSIPSYNYTISFHGMSNLTIISGCPILSIIHVYQLNYSVYIQYNESIILSLSTNYCDNVNTIYNMDNFSIAYFLIDSTDYTYDIHCPMYCTQYIIPCSFDKSELIIKLILLAVLYLIIIPAFIIVYILQCKKQSLEIRTLNESFEVRSLDDPENLYLLDSH